NFVGSIVADGGTDREPAVLRAIAMRPDVIFFLTDADDAMSDRELARINQANGRVGAAICVIDFGTRDSPPPYSASLMKLASDNDGQYVYINATRLTGN